MYYLYTWNPRVRVLDVIPSVLHCHFRKGHIRSSKCPRVILPAPEVAIPRSKVPTVEAPDSKTSSCFRDQEHGNLKYWVLGPSGI